MFTLCQCSVPLAKAFESLGAHRDGQKWLSEKVSQRETCAFVTLINAWGNQLKREKDFFCFMISEVLLDGLSSIAFGPVLRHCSMARVCVEKASLSHGIHGKRGRQDPNIPPQDMPLSTLLLLPGPYHLFKAILPTPTTSHNTIGLNTCLWGTLSQTTAATFL